MDQNKIGKFIEKARKARHLTQQQLADILGVSNTAISKWEHGNNLPDISMLEPLSIALKVDMLDLLTAQSSTHTKVSKKCAQQRKNKSIRFILIVITLILFILATNFITYHNCNKITERILSEQIQVYKISSTEDSFIIEGYIIFNDKENLIYIEKITYQETTNLNIDYTKIKEVNYYLELNGYKILKETQILDKSPDSLSEIFKLYHGNSYKNDNKYFNKNRNFKEAKLIIHLNNKERDRYEISVPVILEKSFI